GASLGGIRRVCGSTLLAAQRSGSTGLLQGAAGQVPRPALRSYRHYQTRRARFQGHLLPRAGGAVRVLRRSSHVLYGAEGGRRAVFHSAQLDIRARTQFYFGCFPDSVAANKKARSVTGPSIPISVVGDDPSGPAST